MTKDQVYKLPMYPSMKFFPDKPQENNTANYKIVVQEQILKWQTLTEMAFVLPEWIGDTLILVDFC